MKTITYLDFKDNLKDYMKKINNKHEPIIVVSENPNEDIVVLSKRNWNSLQETIRLMNNEYLAKKVADEIKQIKQRRTTPRKLLDMEDI